MLEGNLDEFYMLEAIEEQKAGSQLESPIGAVIVSDGKILAKAIICEKRRKVPTSHAELLAIEEACKKAGPAV